MAGVLEPCRSVASEGALWFVFLGFSVGQLVGAARVAPRRGVSCGRGAGDGCDGETDRGTSALKPAGLYVEHGRELVRVNTRSGYGNFHMKPNGVFYISGDRAAVAETRAFLKHRPRVDLATQSGPMLVIDGRLHPRFDRHSISLKTRDGVGVRADGKVIFAISQGEVSFDAFARLFRDGLGCPNALFLDGGSASSLYAPSFNHHSNIVSLGPMLAVFERTRGASRR